MSLLVTESQPCAIIVKSSVSDGQGGQITAYVKSREFNAVISADRSETKIVGDKETSAKSYKIMYPNEVTLSLNSVVQSLNDGKIYRIKGEGTKSAKSSTIQYSVAPAEDWSLPNDEV